MKVLAIVQAWNKDDPVRGFTVDWINELATRVEEVIVLTLEQRQSSTRPNITVYSLGKEHRKQHSRWQRGAYLLQWHRQMQHIFREHRPDVIFTHMAPIYSILSFPYAKIRKTPIVTWFAHGKVSMTVRLAHWVSDKIVTSTKDGFRIDSEKVKIIGQGIDTQRFVPLKDPKKDNKPFTILTLGRLAPIKRVDLMIDAVALLRQKQPDLSLCFTVVGGTVTEEDHAYFTKLQHQVEENGLQNIVDFKGDVSFADILPYYQQADCFVNMSETGSMDKTVLEAMSCGLPVITSNIAFKMMLHKWSDNSFISQPSSQELASKLELLLMMPWEKRGIFGNRLRQIILNDHDLEHLVDRLLAHLHQ